MIIGISRGTKKAHIARAALEAIALQVGDLYRCMESSTPAKELSLKVDGGATQNKLLMQLQADLISTKIQRNQQKESSSLGIALMCIKNSGCTENFYPDNSDQWDEFVPTMEKSQVSALITKWHRAVKRSQHWLKDESL